MSNTLLQLPPELLSQILSSLPTRDLLTFSLASHRTKKLATANLHTLEISYHTLRSYITSSHKPTLLSPRNPHKPPIFLNLTHDFAILLNLHCALSESLLRRYIALRTLSLTLWTFTPPMAHALARLPILHDLHIRIDKPAFAPRSYKRIDSANQRKAWDTLTASSPSPSSSSLSSLSSLSSSSVSAPPAWAAAVRKLWFENCDVETEQLVRLLRSCTRVREFGVSGCGYVNARLVEFMGARWDGRKGLRTLMLDECDGMLDADALDAITGLSGLQLLDLGICGGLDREAIMERNKDVWHIKEVLLLDVVVDERNGILEVDPAYMMEEEEVLAIRG